VRRTQVRKESHDAWATCQPVKRIERPHSTTNGGPTSSMPKVRMNKTSFVLAPNLMPRFSRSLKKASIFPAGANEMSSLPVGPPVKAQA
jgi:hypothetical protein